MTLNYINYLINNYKEYELSPNFKNKLLKITYSNWNLEYVNALKTNLLKQVLLTKKHYRIFSLLWWFSLVGFTLGLIDIILYLVLILTYNSVLPFLPLLMLFCVIYFASLTTITVGWFNFSNNVMRIHDIRLLIKNIEVIIEAISDQEKTALLPKWIKQWYDQGYFSLNPLQKRPNKQWSVHNIFRFKKNLKIWIILHQFLIEIIDFCIKEKLLKPTFNNYNGEEFSNL